MPLTDEFYESFLPELTGSLCEVLTLENRPLFVGEFYSYDPAERLLQINLRHGNNTPGGVIHHTPVKLQLHGSFGNQIPLLYATVLRCAPTFWRLELERAEFRANQRRSFRQRVSLNGSVGLHPNKTAPCRLVDLSVTGVLFQCREHFSEGDTLYLSMPPIHPKGDAYFLVCVVRRVLPPQEASGMTSYGCEFAALSRRDEERMYHDLFQLQICTSNRQPKFKT